MRLAHDRRVVDDEHVRGALGPRDGGGRRDAGGGRPELMRSGLAGAAGRGAGPRGV